MKFVNLLLLLGAVFHITAAWAQDPCPKKYWTRQATDLNAILRTKMDGVNLKQAADFVLTPSSRSDLILMNNDCGQIAWFETRRLEGYLDMYQATQDQKYLDSFVTLADEIYQANDIFTGKVDELRGKVVFGWSSRKYTAHFQRHFHGVQAGIIAELYARFSRTVKEKKLAAYDLKASEYAIIAARTLNSVIDDWNPSEKFFHFKPLAAPKNKILYPYNQGLAIGSAYIELYRMALLGGNTAHANNLKRMILLIGNYFKRALEYDPRKERYLWRYAPEAYYEDMSHASLDLNFVMKAYEVGLLFDVKDMARFANTLTHAYLPESNEFGRYIDGKKLAGFTNWYSMTCLMLVDFARFQSTDSLTRNCNKTMKGIIDNKNVLKDLDSQHFGLLMNGIPKLYKVTNPFRTTGL